MKEKFKHRLTAIAAATVLMASMTACDVWNGYVGMDVGTPGPVGANIGISVPVGGYGPYYYNNPPVMRPIPRPMPPMRPMRPAPIGPFFPQ